MTSTTPTAEEINSWILVLSTSTSSNVPIVIDGSGQKKKLGFSYQSRDDSIPLTPNNPGSSMGTGVSLSCSVVWKGDMYVFGGVYHERQVSMVDRETCELRFLSELMSVDMSTNFEFYDGGCAQRNNQNVFLCFSAPNRKDCWESGHPDGNFIKLQSSTYSHASTRIAVTSGETCKVLKFV